MRRIRRCIFETIEDQFNFGKYRGLSLADVLDVNSSYLDWCVKHCTGIIVQIEDNVIKEINNVYPEFQMDALFESKRIWQKSRDGYEECNNEDNDNNDDYTLNLAELPRYDRYSGSWAQNVEDYSDDEIDTVFDGDPSAYWNID